ncbi:MAG: 16S rRNA (guanine(527)-N(7))-methyltransferase RsmG [Anaerolineae bacterium]|nr:16S rRNA (guanine(527)-N(7))-methyltransferase RsmG [Anaerolineae bacterium]
MKQLAEGARHLGLTMSDKQLNSFQTFYEILVQWNQQFNLTAITEYDQVQIRHFLDSLSCLVALRHQRYSKNDVPLSCIDIGSGAGFPGIPIKIYCPQIKIVLLEATSKKVDFLRHVITQLGLTEITPLKGRAEEVAQTSQHREQYDVVLARAVAPLPVLAEYLLPFCRPGGIVIAQKGASAQEETQAAEYAIAVLGGKLKTVLPIELLGLAETRNLVLIEKSARTPAKYPRRPGIPSKRPLKRTPF